MGFARIWARFAHLFRGCPLYPPCQQKLFARSVDYGDKKLETTATLWYTGDMPRRIRDYLDRFSHRDTYREEPNTYTVNTTVNMNDWARWNTTQRFPENEVPHMEVSRAYHHDMDDPTAEVSPGRTVRASEVFRMTEENMTAREVMEMAATTPEDMLRMMRVVPNIDYLSNVIEERPMDPPPQRHSLYVHDMDTSPVYSEYRPTWSNRSVFRSWGNRGLLEFRRGRIIRVKRYCKI